ncbi:hypothetical protein GCM10010393_26560 [Streptomyces gobitricini]|uniref:Uncharacterized protein n=1 Tax=Streptomyces gobitricini TaxID=68211 RepID=A0ABP5Z9Z1_9ACTN
MLGETLSSTSWMDNAPWPVSWLTGHAAATPPSRTPRSPAAFQWLPEMVPGGWSRTSRSQWRGPHRYRTGFPYTKALRH